jgi:hypothetical protein
MKFIKKIFFIIVVIATFAFCFAGCENTYIPHHEVIEITIKTPPTKTEYQLGDTFSSEGMILKVRYDDGFFSYEDDFTCSIPEGTVLTTADAEFTATYEGLTVTQKINVSLPDDLFSMLNAGYSTVRMEAEDSVMVLPENNTIDVGTEGRDVAVVNNPSGGVFVAKLSGVVNYGSTFTFNFTAEEEGWCVVSFCMGSIGSTTSGDVYFDQCLSLSANGERVGVTQNPVYSHDDWQTDGSGTKTGWWNWNKRQITIFRLKKGENTFVVSKAGADNKGLNWDYIEMSSNTTITWNPANGGA